MIDTFPIFDYYTSLPISDVTKNIQYANLTQAFLQRTTDTHCLTACSSDEKERFLLFSERLFRSIGSPIEECMHSILTKAFLINSPLTPETAEDIWGRTESMLSSPGFSCHSILNKLKIRSFSVPFSSADDLQYFQARGAGSLSNGVKIQPMLDASPYFTLRSKGYVEKVSILSADVRLQINTADDLLSAIERQVDHFYAVGANRLVLDLQSLGDKPNAKKANKVFQKTINALQIKKKAAMNFSSYLLNGLALMCAKRNWLLHIRIRDASLTAEDISNLFHLFASLRKESALSRTLISCRSAELFSIVCMMLHDADAQMRQLILPVISAEYGSGAVIRQASTLARFSLLDNCAGLSSESSCIFGLAGLQVAQEKLGSFFQSIAGEERAEALMRRICVDQPMRFLGQNV